MAPRKTREHPLFPGRDAPERLSIWRIGRSPGRSEVKRKLWGPGDPWQYETAEVIQEEFGAGEYEIIPHTLEGKLSGNAVRFELADERGDVPRHLPGDAGASASSGAAAALVQSMAGGDGGASHLFAQAMLGFFTEANRQRDDFIRAELSALAGQTDKVTTAYESAVARYEARMEAATAAVRELVAVLGAVVTRLDARAPGNGAAGTDATLVNLLGELRKDLSGSQREVRELAEKVAAKDSGGMKELGMAAISIWEKKEEREQKRLELLQKSLADRPPRAEDSAGVKLTTLPDHEGKPVEVPTPEELARLVKSGELDQVGLDILRALHRQRPLPPAYVDVLGRLLVP